MTVHDIAQQLPGTVVLREHCRSLAVLDALLCPERAFRRHSFDAHWSGTESVAFLRDGSGDEYSIVFSAAGACVRGFAHESPMSPYETGVPWPGVLDDLPEVFRPFVAAPAFSDRDGMPRVTACLWREPGDAVWRTGAIDFPEGTPGDPDGAGHLFPLLADRSAQTFQRFAEDCYELPVDLAAVRHVLASRPLTDAVVTALRPGITLADLGADLAETGYPQG
ncbi:hypothetical protein ACWIG3_10000 [Streptomyces celluloflavus]